MKNDLVVKSNDLIEGIFDMTTQQYKIVLYLISKINKKDKEFRKVNLTIEEFANEFNTSACNLYNDMKNYEKEFLDKYIIIKNEKGEPIKINWFSYSQYKKSEGVIVIAFNHDLSQFLLDIETNYTKYFLKNIKNMKSISTIKIYELMKKDEYKHKIEIKYDELKRHLNIEYKDYCNFKRRVLETAKKDIDKFTDITINYKENKTGKKVTSLTFYITPKEKPRIDDFEISKTKYKKPKYNQPNFEQREYSDEFYDSLVNYPQA